MKLAAAVLSLIGAVSAAPKKQIVLRDVPANSKMGLELLSKARRLDEQAQQNNYNQQNQWDASGQYAQQGNNNNNNNKQNNNQNNAANNGNYQANYNNNNQGYMNYNGGAADYDSWYGNNAEAFQNYYMQMHTWVSDYSIKFQGCHHVSEWNQEADDEGDVRILTRRLVKFRLCPSQMCLDSKSEGCDAGYGDYIIDLDTFLEAYLVAKETYEGWMEDMAEQNGYQYYGNNGNEELDISEYTQCQQTDIDYQRDQNQNANYYQAEDEEEIDAIYMGPYCASQGGAIYIGLFTDDQCTQALDSSYGRSIYYQSTGETMPFGATSLVDMTCFPCSEPSGEYAYQNNQGNDEQDEDEVCEACETLYTFSGKCEENLPFNTKNNNACNYLDGIKVIREDGTVLTTNRASGGSKRGRGNYGAAYAFVGIFSAAFLLLSAYVYYLKEKLDRASIQVIDE